MKNSTRILLGVFLIFLVGISFNFPSDYRIESSQATDFSIELSKIPSGAVIAIQLAARFDESVEISPAFSALLWYFAQRDMRLVFIPFLPESELMLWKSMNKVRFSLPNSIALPEVISITQKRNKHAETPWTLCAFTPGSLFAMQHFALDNLGCWTQDEHALQEVQAVVVVGSTSFDGMPAPMLYSLFGQKTHFHIPLFVVASAQKRALLEPLVQTKQIAAMISGNRNSVALSTKLNVPIDFSKKATTITAITLATVVLLIGLMIQTLFRKRK